MRTNRSDSPVPDAIIDDPRYLHIPPLLVLLIGISGVGNWLLNVHVPFLQYIYEPSILSVILTVIGIGALISQFYAFRLKEFELESEREKIDKRKEKLRELRDEADRRRRRSFSLGEFDQEYKGEPLRGQTTEGYVVYAGEHRSDDVYVVEKVRDGSVNEVSEQILEMIEEGLRNESIDWLERP